MRPCLALVAALAGCGPVMPRTIVDAAVVELEPDAAREVVPDAAARAPADLGPPPDAARPPVDAARGPDAARTVDAASPPRDAPPRVDLAPVGNPCAQPASRTVAVKTVNELRAALTAAQPGDSIQLEAGTYAGKFTLAASGQPGKPIMLCGPRGAIIDGGSGGYALHVTGSRLVIAGLTVRGGQKSIMLDGASDNLLTDLEVSGAEFEGVHFRMNSARNVLSRSFVHDTGSGAPGFGEGVYIGSAGGGDASNENQILDNEITRTAAECIDVKEGTHGGRIAGNRFGGESLSGENFADSWLDMKGSDYVVEDNVGAAGSAMLKDGYQIHNVAADSGAGNVFRRNAAEGPGSGFGFSVDPKAVGNVIACDNRIAGSWMGLADVACQ